jgi:hypothetical protein
MNILILRIIKIAVFILSFLIVSRLFLSFFRKRNPGAALYDPEIVAIAVIIAAVITTAVSLILKSFI